MGDLTLTGTSPIALTLKALADAASNVTGIDSNRVYLGYKRWDDCDDFTSLVTADNIDRELEGFVSIWFDRFSSEGFIKGSVIYANAELILKVPKNDSTYLSQAYDMAYDLLAEWQDVTNFTGGAQAVTRGSFTAQMSTIQSAGTIKFVYGPDGGLEIPSAC